MSNRTFSLSIAAAFLVSAIIALSSCVSSPTKSSDAALRGHTLIDADWRFHRGDVSSNETDQVVAASYNDREWQAVHLPHDYVLDGTYSTNNVRNHGYLPFEPAWYRKHFVISKSDEGKILQLQFDGVFRNSKVWLNGKFLGRHESGYTGFFYDITKDAHYGGENVITVRVDPTEFEGWWYEGGGIYRHVYLNALSPLHLAEFGTYVTSKVPDGAKGADALAEITIQTTITNASGSSANCAIESEILDPDGASLATLKAEENTGPTGAHEFTQQTTIEHPRLWSPDSPQLYHLRTTVLQDGKPVDSTITTFGIRTAVFDAEKGFFLNGKHIEIQGVANHQDFPVVGIAMPDSLQPWRVTQLKQLGCNAWRTAHNSPNDTVLDSCDRLGMLVMDENRHLGDTYHHHALSNTPPGDLADLAFMIQRDRNHPSIIMWSMCNEEGLQGKPEGAKLFTAMMNVVHRYDRTRPISCAMNNGWLTPSGIANVEDLVGVNYNIERYDAIHKRHPDKPMFGSEDTNDKTTRGEYADDAKTGMRSCYNLSEKGWLAVVERPFMCGSFTWTGFDYKGEPNPYGWPDVSNNTGLLDCCGFPKDKAFYFESCWTEKPMVHLMPINWNKPVSKDGTNRVIAFSNAGEVELFLNGKSLGVQTVPKDGHAEWNVAFEPGKLSAQARNDGKVVATDEVETTGAPAHIQVSCDRKTLHLDGEDTVVVPVSILDAQGRLVPDANNRVTFKITGSGRVLGAANGNPADHDSDRADNRKAFNGRCIAVVQAGTHAGEIHLTAMSPGLEPAELVLQAR